MRPLLRGTRYTSGARTTCPNSVREGAAIESICPLTGRVGNRYGGNWPDHAPAQFTTIAARNLVLAAVTPTTRPTARSRDVTGSPDEKSTPRCFDVFCA